jgi:hypothetical protein
VVVADALFDNDFLIGALRALAVDVVAGVQAERVGTGTVQSRPDGDRITWPRPHQPRGLPGEP